MPLDKLTQRAKRVIFEAREAAGDTSSCGRILDILGKEKKGVAAEVIAGWKRDFDLEKKVSLSELLEAAYDEARRLKSPYVGTEHFFLGLVRLEDPANLKRARRKVRQVASLPRSFFSPHEPSSTPLLDAFGTNLTDLAREGKLDPFIGREEILERIIRILLRKEKNNPVLVGERGVGKTALTRGLAIKIAESAVPIPLLNTKVIQLDFPSFASSFFPRGDLEAGFSSLLEEALAKSNIVLFVDEFHTLMGGGGVLGVSSGLINILKDALVSDRLKFLGATSLSEYKRHLEFDQALTRRLQPVLVPEPTEVETEAILEALAPKFEEFHRVKYSPRALREAVVLSKGYIADAFLPDKALDVIDEAGAWVRSQKEQASFEVQNAFRGFAEAEKSLRKAIESRDFDEAVNLRFRKNLLQRRIESFTPEKEKRIGVGREIIARVVSKRTGIPLAKIEKDEEEKFRDLEKYLSEKVIGQDHAVKVLSRALRRSRVGISDPRRPIGSFLFLGPTGVGKTELARTLADFLFGSRARLIRIDMSEFRERHTTARLIGAPPGYVGYGQGGELTKQIRANPYSVVVFDEMEKAHPEVLNLLLQIMEEGELTDGQGETASFRHAVIILTSNVGADLIKKGDLGFSASASRRRDGSVTDSEEGAYESMKERLISNLKEKVRPEFLNRLSEVVVFRALAEVDILKIVDLRLEELSERLSSKDLGIKVTRRAKELLAEKGYSEEYGARPLQRVIEEEIEAPLSEKIVGGEISEGDMVEVKVSGARIVLEKL